MPNDLAAYRDLFGKRSFATLVTLRPDGLPQATPVWIDADGGDVVFNTARGRAKDRHLQRDPRVTLSIQDPDNPYRYAEIRGRVVGRTEDGADAHIDALAKRYLGKDTYPFRQPGEVRVIYRIRPEGVHGT